MQAEAGGVVIRAMRKKIARSLAMEEQDIDVEQPMNRCGVDSLIGVELRN